MNVEIELFNDIGCSWYQFKLKCFNFRMLTLIPMLTMEQEGRRSKKKKKVKNQKTCNSQQCKFYNI